MSERVLIAGVGMAPFIPLSARKSAVSLAGRAIRSALEDARIDFDLVDQVFTSFVHGEVGSAEHVLAQTGLTGIPIFSISDGCTSAISAFQLAHQSVLAGETECALALGFECMPASISNQAFFGLDEPPEQDWDSLGGRNDPLTFDARRRHPVALFAAQMNWLLTRMGIAENSFERVMNQARAQARLNPYAILKCSLGHDGSLAPYLCRPANGAAAVLLCTPAFIARYGARGDVAVLASVRGSDIASEQESGCVLDVLGRAATRRIAQQAYEKAGVGIEDIDVVELHDQSVGDFMVYSAALGLCQEDQINAFVRERRSSCGAQIAVCPSGGLLGRGHAPGATGLAQITELVWQLRDVAQARQINGARTALQHGAALGRAVSVTILQRT